MTRKTVNIEKLTRHDIDTDRLQEFALELIKTLYNRAEDDYSETMKQGYVAIDSEEKDDKRRKKLKEIYEKLKVLPLRGEKWRHKLH
jgi:hypothetical protein